MAVGASSSRDADTQLSTLFAGLSIAIDAVDERIQASNEKTNRAFFECGMQIGRMLQLEEGTHVRLLEEKQALQVEVEQLVTAQIASLRALTDNLSAKAMAVVDKIQGLEHRITCMAQSEEYRTRKAKEYYVGICIPGIRDFNDVVQDVIPHNVARAAQSYSTDTLGQVYLMFAGRMVFTDRSEPTLPEDAIVPISDKVSNPALQAILREEEEKLCAQKRQNERLRIEMQYIRQQKSLLEDYHGRMESALKEYYHTTFKWVVTYILEIQKGLSKDQEKAKNAKLDNPGRRHDMYDTISELSKAIVADFEGIKTEVTQNFVLPDK